MNAIIYTRVSTKEQAEDGNSLPVQEKQCRAYALQHNFKVIKTFTEEGFSAKTTNRPMLQAMIKYAVLHKKDIDLILYSRLDRLARDRMDYGQLKAFFGGLGIKVVSISEQFDDDPVGRFIENTLAGVAQLDNEIRATRSKDGMVEGVEAGRWMWKAPLGFKNTRVNGKKNIAPISDETSAHIRKAWVLVDSGVSLAEARRRLTAQGLRTNEGNEVSFQLFSKMFDKPIYKGVVKAFGKEIVSDSIPVIVEPELWDRVDSRLTDKNTKPKTYQRLSPDFPLRGTILCDLGHRLTASSPRGNGGVYPQYHCPKCRGRGTAYGRDRTESNFVSHLNRFNYTDDIKDALRTAIDLTIEDREKSSKTQMRQLERRLLELQGQEIQIGEKNLKGLYKDDVTARMLRKNETEQKQVSSDLADLQLTIYDTGDVLDFGLNKLSGIGYTWQEIDDVYIKVRFQKWLFPVGISYNGEKFGTSQMPLCVSIKNDLSEEKSLLVSPERLFWNTLYRGILDLDKKLVELGIEEDMQNV